MIAANAYIESTTVNLAEYAGLNRGTQAALDNNVTDLVIVGDSRLAIRQSMGVIACRNESLRRNWSITKLWPRDILSSNTYT